MDPYLENYHKKIDAVLEVLDKARPDNATLDRLEGHLDQLARQYHQDMQIGKDRFKLFVAQAMIEYYRAEHDKATFFMEEAVRIKGERFAFAEEFLRHTT
jgi:hypothetical protein